MPKGINLTLLERTDRFNLYEGRYTPIFLTQNKLVKIRQEWDIRLQIH